MVCLLVAQVQLRVATIFNGEITDINITDFGSGYSDQILQRFTSLKLKLLKHL